MLFRILLMMLLCLPDMLMAADTEPVESIRAAVLGIFDDGAEIVLDPAIKMPPCREPLQARRSGNGLAEVSCAAPSRWRLFVPVRIHRHAPVLVLARGVAAGEAISADLLRQETRDTSRIVGAPLSEPGSAIGQVARRALAGGSVLVAAHLRAPDLVRRGELVRLVSRRGGIEVRMEGRALSAAGVGERISVENLSSRRRVQGVVLADGDVQVRH